MTSQNELRRSLAPSLLDKAVDLAPFGVNEIAFPIRGARDVLNAIIAAGIVVYGGDLWRRSDDGLTLIPTGDNWWVEILSVESQGDFVRRLRARLDDFLSFHEENCSYFLTFVV